MKTKKKCLMMLMSGLFLTGNIYAQNDVKPTGIEIVSKLEKPATKFKEKDLSGYLLVYFKDQDQSAYMAISSDGYT